MKDFSIYLKSPEITDIFGISLGKLAEAGEVICLDGDLGSGKTTLTQAIGKGLEIPPEYYITSPSFNIFHEYPGRISLYHMDFYRLHSSEDVMGIGLDEYFDKEGLCIIEWSKKALDILPEDRLSIRFKTVSDTARQLICSFTQQSWQHKLESIAHKIS